MARDQESFEITEEFVISIGQGKDNKKWVTKTTEKNGCTFVKLEKFDRGFVKFCLGESMCTTRKHKNEMHKSANVPQFNGLVEQRRNASVAAAEKVLAEDDKKSKKRKVREEDVHLCNPVVNIHLPAVAGLAQASAQVLWGVKAQDLWIELTKDNLQHIRALVQQGQKSIKIRKRASPKKKTHASLMKM